MAVDTEVLEQLSEEVLGFVFATCVLECRLPHCQNPRKPGAGDRTIQSNISACCNLEIGLDFMKKNIKALNRLDLEQAAAIVISAVRNDDKIANRAETIPALVNALDHTLLTQSCMWLEADQWSPGAEVEEAKLAGVVGLLRRMLRKRSVSTESSDVSITRDICDWSVLLPLLLCVRRCSPRRRCLFVPQWIFNSAGVEPPPEFAIWDRRGCVQPGREPNALLEPNSDNIVLSRKAFRALQRRLLRYNRFWKPEIGLRNAIVELEANVIYSAEHIRSIVLPSQSTLEVAHYFFAVQRRLQRKVVSDLHWTGFLGKGESGNIMQNNPDIPTTFEKRLGDLSGQIGIPITGHLLSQIDQCCLLMEKYVSVYGNGDRRSLTFVRGSKGGSGRGAVDDYNLLCDILKTLCKAAKEKGLDYPGPVRKFLAKDIMAYNGSFGDDAFANDAVPGWENWLTRRKVMGVLQGMADLDISTAFVMSH